MQAKSVGEKGKKVNDEFGNKICDTETQRRTATFPTNIEVATQRKQSEHKIIKMDIKTKRDQRL